MAGERPGCAESFGLGAHRALPFLRSRPLRLTCEPRPGAQHPLTHLGCSLRDRVHGHCDPEDAGARHPLEHVPGLTPVVSPGRQTSPLDDGPLTPMTTYLEADLPVLDLLALPTAADQRRALAEARVAAPLAKGPLGPIVVSHRDVTNLLRDRRLRGPGMDLPRRSGIPEGSFAWQQMERVLLFMEGDDHARLRRLLAKAFTPRSVDALRPSARRIISGLIDSVDADGRCDAVRSLCEPYPVPVICELVGIETDRWRDMARWANAILHSIRFDAGAYRALIEDAGHEMCAFLDELIEQRRANPGDDLLSRLIAVGEEGEHLSHFDLQIAVQQMLVAGTDTTRHQLGNIVHTFARHPDQWALLRQRPELVPTAVEEAIRWEPTASMLPRVALEDLEVGGYTIPAGTFVALSSASANHDSDVLDGSDRFDITRGYPESWHLLTFGGGIHYCLGASLARLELTEALAVFVERFETLRLDGEPEVLPAGGLFGYRSLPISWR